MAAYDRSSRQAEAAWAAIGVGLLMLSGCTGVSLAHDDPAGAEQAVSAVSVTFADHMEELAAGDPRLTPDAVASAIENELRAHRLYTPGERGVQRRLAIKVEDFSSELSGNTTLFGYTARNLVLIGTVQVLGDAPAGQSPFDVHARVNQRNRDPGASAGSLSDLYARFAALAVATLR
jgi:hypothetical protein